MLTELDQTSTTEIPRASARSGIGFPLPPAAVITERATAMLRDELICRGCSDWIIFYATRHDLHDVESHLKALGESCTWEPLSGLASGETPDAVTCDGPGCLLLARGLALPRATPGGYSPLVLGRRRGPSSFAATGGFGIAGKVSLAAHQAVAVAPRFGRSGLADDLWRIRRTRAGAARILRSTDDAFRPDSPAN